MAEADRSKNDQCPRCGRISLHWVAAAELHECRHPGCGFRCRAEDHRARLIARRELEWQACRGVSSDDLLKFAEAGGLPGVKALGYATDDGILHIYEDEEDMRDRIGSRRFGQAGWIKGVRWHAKGGDGRSAVLEGRADG